MKLSDAIMLNGMTKKQGEGADSISSVDAPCAIGGALQAIGKQNIIDADANYDVFRSEWPWVKGYTCCPLCGYSGGHGYVSVLLHLNDSHRWTRQQIAEWVARIEPQEPKQSVAHYCNAVEDRQDDIQELCPNKCAPGKDYCAEHLED